MKSDGNILFMTALVLSMVYFAFPSPTTKILSIWFLALYPMIPGSRAKFNLVSYGLLLSSVGDIFLELGTEGLYFIGGLGFFLLAHVLYIGYFFQKPLRPLPFGVFAVFVCLLLYVLLPAIESELKAPVIVYASVIGVMAGMAVSASMTDSKKSRSSSLYGAVGAIVFVISDTIIAVNKFYAPFPTAKTWVMITYYIGQTLIAASNHLSADKRKNK